MEIVYAMVSNRHSDVVPSQLREEPQEGLNLIDRVKNSESESAGHRYGQQFPTAKQGIGDGA